MGVILFCNPLGQKGITSYYTVIAAAVEAWGTNITCIGWDYRGFFESDKPKRNRTIDVRNHAQDGQEVLKAVLGEGAHADLLVGHSMGVQVALEFALLYPETVGAMVLLNGTFGHALQTGLQPILKVPYMGDVLTIVIFWVLQRGHEQYLDLIRVALAPVLPVIFQIMARLFGSKDMVTLYNDEDYYLKMWDNYMGGICSNAKSMRAFLQGFQVLDAHSVGHLMHQLGHPTLLYAGLWDVLTPAYNMAWMNRALPNSRLVVDNFSGHFSVVEHPQRTMGEIHHFLKYEQPKFERVASFTFEMKEK